MLSCEGQARLGHEVHLAFGPIYGPEGSLLERVERFRTSDGRGITTHVVPHLVREVRPIADRRAFGEIFALVKKFQPDVVHTHSSKAGIVGRAAAWAARRDCPRHDGPPTTQPSPYALHGSTARIVAQEGRMFDRVPRHYPAIVHTIHGPPFMPSEGGLLKRCRRASRAIRRQALPHAHCRRGRDDARVSRTRHRASGAVRHRSIGDGSRAVSEGRARRIP